MMSHLRPHTFATRKSQHTRQNTRPGSSARILNTMTCWTVNMLLRAWLSDSQFCQGQHLIRQRRLFSLGQGGARGGKAIVKRGGGVGERSTPPPQKRRAAYSISRRSLSLAAAPHFWYGGAEYLTPGFFALDGPK